MKRKSSAVIMGSLCPNVMLSLCIMMSKYMYYVIQHLYNCNVVSVIYSVLFLVLKNKRFIQCRKGYRMMLYLDNPRNQDSDYQTKFMSNTIVMDDSVFPIHLTCTFLNCGKKTRATRFNPHRYEENIYNRRHKERTWTAPPRDQTWGFLFLVLVTEP